MMPLLITVSMTNLTGFFATSRTLSQASPIASLPASNAFGTVSLIAVFSGSKMLSRMKCHVVRMVDLLPCHTGSMMLFFSHVNAGPRTFCMNRLIGVKMRSRMNAHTRLIVHWMPDHTCLIRLFQNQVKIGPSTFCTYQTIALKMTWMKPHASWMASWIPAQAGLMIQFQNHMKIGADRKSTRLNSSHVAISYAVFCLKKKKDEIDK